MHYTAQRGRVFPLREHPELRLERKQEGRAGLTPDRVHSVSESRATQGLPATPFRSAQQQCVPEAECYFVPQEIFKPLPHNRWVLP